MQQRQKESNIPPSNPQGESGLSELPAEGESGRGALTATRPSPISTLNNDHSRVLLTGIDTLDFGLYVVFDANYSQIVKRLTLLKRAASKANGQLLGDGRCALIPGGKPNYPFLIQYPGFQLYLSRNRIPHNATPNAYVSLNADLLWHQGERKAVAWVLEELAALAGGTVAECRMSRCDLCADILIPAGITYPFLSEFGVTRHRQRHMYLDQDDLQTLYVGAPDGDIQLRIYAKSIEIVKHDKLWFLKFWGLEINHWVWRFEFQIRREALKEFGIHSLDELLAKQATLWQKLTTDWFSLRLNDNPNVSRRSLHPLWQLLKDCTERFGPLGEPLIRNRRKPSPETAGVEQRAASDLIGLAARMGLTNFEDALTAHNQRMRSQFEQRNFSDECRVKTIKLGLETEREAA